MALYRKFFPSLNTLTRAPCWNALLTIHQLARPGIVSYAWLASQAAPPIRRHRRRVAHFRNGARIEWNCATLAILRSSVPPLRGASAVSSMGRASHDALDRSSRPSQGLHSHPLVAEEARVPRSRQRRLGDTKCPTHGACPSIFVGQNQPAYV